MNNISEIKETDTKKKVIDSVSEQLIRERSDTAHLSKQVFSRLYQFGTKPNARRNVLFGTIFEIGYQKESEDIFIIRKKLEQEIERYKNIIDNETEQGKMIISKAIKNIYEMDIYKIEADAIDNPDGSSTPILIRTKIGNAKELLKCQEI